MSYFIQNGSKFTVTKTQNLNIQDSLPPSNYIVGCDQERGQFFLEEVEGFDLNFKLYGDVTTRAKRILHTFKTRPLGTGVMLSGEKGSGKTLLAKKISIDAHAMGIPTLLVNQPFYGPGFNNFIQSITQEAIVFFDEFEKVYSRSEDQMQLLTLLDGAFPSKKLFILTVNDAFKTDYHMKNRPGRIFYSMDYSGISEEFIREYCEDRLNEKNYIDEIVILSKFFSAFNFDMLAALVEEMNRYGESPNEAVKILNVKPQYSEKTSYDVTATLNGEECRVNYKTWSGNIFNDRITNMVLVPWTEGDDEDYKEEGKIWKDYTFTLKDISVFTQNKIVLKAGDGLVLTLTRPEASGKLSESEVLKRLIL